jgi:hypothetical protein
MQTLNEPEVTATFDEPQIQRQLAIVELIQDEDVPLRRRRFWQRYRTFIWTLLVLFFILIGLAVVVLPALIPAC